MSWDSYEGHHGTIDKVKEMVEERGGLEHFTERLEGRRGSLRPSKPRAQDDDELEQYVWRMARFYSGKDPSMPVTCFWDLGEFLEEQGVDARIDMILDSDGDEITEYLDFLACRARKELGVNPTRGAEIWKKAGIVPED